MHHADDAGASRARFDAPLVRDGGEPPQPSPCAANIRGGSQAVTTERDSMPAPKFNVTATGFPSRSSNSVGTNQHEIPGPVAMAC